jgi:hypothetical protein
MAKIFIIRQKFQFMVVIGKKLNFGDMRYMYPINFRLT